MNNVMLLGRVTKDLELKGNDTKFCSFSLAVNRKTKNKETDFINCKAFGKTAEMICQYVTKGQQIAIDGRIQTGSYEKDGTKVYTTDVIVTSFYFADGKKESSSSDNEFVEMKKTGDEALPWD